jgi:hypothetical protein
MRPQPRSSSSAPRSIFAFKRTWTVAFLIFAALWLSVFRFGVRATRKKHSSHSSSSSTSSSTSHTSLDPCTSLLRTRAVSFRCFLDNSNIHSPTKGNALSNDMGFCRTGSTTGSASTIHGKLDFVQPIMCPSKIKTTASSSSSSSMSLLSFLFGNSDKKKVINKCTSSDALVDLIEEANSPLCREISPKSLNLLKSLTTTTTAAHGDMKAGKLRHTTKTTTISSSSTPSVWSSAVCGFLAREVAAIRLTKTIHLEDIDTPKHTVRACGVTIGPADLIEHCGLEPILSEISEERVIDPFSRDVPQTFFLWNKALAASTDASPHHMIDGTYDFNSTPYLLSSPTATTFYVVASVLHHFVDQIVPKVTLPFLVISGSSDDGSPLPNTDSNSEMINLKRIRGFLENPLLIALFVQNPNYKDRKIVPNHIGLDYHTLARMEITEHGWGTPISVLRQDAELMTLRCSLTPFANRPPKALINFKESGRGIRSMVSSLLKDRPGVQYVGNLERSALWGKYGEFAFVISPRGYGLDCHRTWEALALGSAVIASVDDFLHELYEDLPVIQVSNWDIVNQDNLQRWHLELSKKWGTFKFEKLREAYWTSAIERAQRQASLEGIYEYSTNSFNYSAGKLAWGRK